MEDDERKRAGNERVKGGSSSPLGQDMQGFRVRTNHRSQCERFPPLQPRLYDLYENDFASGGAGNRAMIATCN